MIGQLKGEDPVEIVVLRKGKKEIIAGVKLAKVVEADLEEQVRRAKMAREKAMEEAQKALEQRQKLNEKFAEAKGKAGNKGSNVSSVSVSITDDEFTIQAQKNAVRYDIQGSLKDGKPVPSSISIREGDKKQQYSTLEKVPAAHKAEVESLLGNINN